MFSPFYSSILYLLDALSGVAHFLCFSLFLHDTKAFLMIEICTFGKRKKEVARGEFPLERSSLISWLQGKGPH
jgi:hypothetical protein